MDSNRPTKSTSSAARPVAQSPRGPRRKNVLLVAAGGATAFVLIVLLVAGNAVIRAKRPGTTDAAQQQVAPIAPRAAAPHDAASSSNSSSSVIDDDGNSFWISPTHGGPLDLAYLAPGAQVVIALRPAELRRHAEGERILQSLGPIGQQVSRLLAQTLPINLATVDQLLVGCQPTSDGRWLNTFVVHSLKPIPLDQLFTNLPNVAEQSHKETKYQVAGGTAYFLPRAGSKHILVAAPEESICDIIDLAGQPPALRRDLERLIARTDSARQFTVVLAPNALFSEGQTMFAGGLAPLRNALFWFLGDEFSGAALSLHWNADFFVEVIAVPTLETSAEKAAQILGDRVQQIPQALEPYIAHLNPQPYSRQVVQRLPRMVSQLAAFTRTGYEQDHAALRCYLPAAAGHNMLMAGELTLAEASAGTFQVAEAAAPTADQHADASSAKSGLNKVTSLKFARDTLESALDQLSQDIGVPIVIRGTDLQADGITKNQSFEIDLSHKPAAEILVEILRLANPDKAATSPHDPRQKLVYVLGQTPDKTVQIVVTTRAKAAERGEELPAAFQPEKQ